MPMEYVLNELSLCGQYADREQFVTNGIKPLLGVIKTLSSFGVNDILKKSTFYDSEVTKDLRLHDLTKSRMSPAVLAVCSQLSKMQGEPFWDIDSEQQSGMRYFLRRPEVYNATVDEDVTATGVAEAYARKGCLISFRNGGYDGTTEQVRREDEPIYVEPALTNLHDKEETEQFLFDSGQIDYQGYIMSRYCGKLVYDELSINHGLNLVRSTNFRQFFDSFKNFEEYSWHQIITSDGFDYKEFKKNKNTRSYFSPDMWAKGIHKFRVSQEIRCFGYREGEKFHLLRIDLDHVLSDKG